MFLGRNKFFRYISVSRRRIFDIGLDKIWIYIRSRNFFPDKKTLDTDFKPCSLDQIFLKDLSKLEFLMNQTISLFPQLSKFTKYSLFSINTISHIKLHFFLLKSHCFPHNSILNFSNPNSR